MSPTTSAIAIAKGWRQINLQGGGDHSRIDVALATLYPGLVRSVVIVDPVPWDAPANTWAVNLNASLEKYYDACHADSKCDQTFPSLKASVTSLYDQLQQDPRLISTKDPLRDGNVGVLLDGDRFLYSLLVGLNTQNALGVVASTISSNSDARLSATAAFLAENAPLSPDLPWAFWNSMDCEDIQPLVSRSAVEAGDVTYPIFHGFAVNALDQFDLCSVWDTNADSALSTERKVSPVPALILAGELSPFFPASFAEAAGESFTDPHIAVFPNLTGLPLRDGPKCVSDLRMAFLRDPKALLDIEGCKNIIPKIKFEGVS